MSGFELVPVGGGAPIQLPPGETVLGRGPFLGVSDKRVSRLHGLLENLDGQLRLKPTHLNPCFVQSSLSDEPRPLQRDCWFPLHHGDVFSLLPGQFLYQVVAVGGEDRTPRNSQTFEEEEELPVSPKPDVERPPPAGQDRGQTPPREEPTPAALPQQEEADRGFTQRDSEAPTEAKDDVTPPAPRRRVLPAWMMAAVAAPLASSSSPKVPSAVKRSRGPAAASGSSKPAAARTSSPEEETPRKRRRKRRRKRSEEEEEVQTKTPVPVRLQTGPNRSEVSDESDGFDEEERGATSTADIAPATRTHNTGRPESEDKPQNGQTTRRAESVSAAAPSRPGLRAPCPYGKDCYRKNPLHFQECCHPGDTDYVEEVVVEEEVEERPECPYGTDCYRKNPLHRKEYRHTKRPASSRRTVRTRPPAAAEDEEDEELEDDDSFINDDSEDVGEDSDYVPPDSDDSGKEDIKGLQREAKAFLRRK